MQLTALRKEDTTTVSENQRFIGIAENIRACVLSCDSKAYSCFFGLVKRADTENDGNLIPPYHSFDKKELEKGRFISFSIAGSSFAQPLRCEKSLADKSNIWLFDEQQSRKAVQTTARSNISCRAHFSLSGIKNDIVL